MIYSVLVGDLNVACAQENAIKAQFSIQDPRKQLGKAVAHDKLL